MKTVYKTIIIQSENNKGEAEESRHNVLVPTYSTNVDVIMRFILDQNISIISLDTSGFYSGKPYTYKVKPMDIKDLTGGSCD